MLKPSLEQRTQGSPPGTSQSSRAPIRATPAVGPAVRRFLNRTGAAYRIKPPCQPGGRHLGGILPPEVPVRQRTPRSARCGACALLRLGCVVARSSLPARFGPARPLRLAPPVIGSLPTFSCKRCYKPRVRVPGDPALGEAPNRPSSDFSSVRHSVNARDAAWI